MRLWRLKQGLRWALRCQALPGKTWELLLGHTTFVALLKRDALSVPFALNKFIRANYDDSARLWPSARAEVQAFVGLLPAIVCCWTRGWCTFIVAADASEYGFGVRLKDCKKDVCEIIGRTSELARFRKCHPDTPGARTTFFDQHRLGSDSRGDLIDLLETEDATAEMMLLPIDGFPEVPLEVDEASGWVDVASGRWRHRNESIIVLESRVLTRGVEILASTQLFRKRCVALVDNMAAALSFERRRSRNFLC